ncbi:hypothetical protein DEM26_04235 [Thioclava sp. NG1]|uniref:Hint domain-containing protein n=1 Tax=Thioclava sp. NG1 TaxID=2182426 RepID=UPI000D609BFA|nr:Hint domain-containing protein [Thioclava sp. NG1]PWE51378.1 hypothetical protein DEM26_04235 [Thioclava sp. NG1]
MRRGRRSFTRWESPCVTKGTRLATPRGPRRVESLQPGDLVTTLDDGPQPVLWCAHRRFGAARCQSAAASGPAAARRVR